MPRVSRINIDRFRNIDSASMAPSPYLNFIVGPNGSGKTSVLECLSVLAHAKSFRTHKFRNLIQQGAESFTVHAEVGKEQIEEDAPALRVGVSRSKDGDCRIKVGDRIVSTASVLATELPLIVINSKSFGLVEGGPKERRQFLDWLVFHVKHGFGDNWKTLTQCLKQRNALLRRRDVDYAEVYPWDLEIARLSSVVDRQRRECFENFNRSLFGEIGLDVEDLETESFRLEYSSGWRESGVDTLDESEMRAQLENSFERDLASGFTSVGSQRADIRIKYGRQLANDVLSRGQVKTLVASMYMASAEAFKKGTSRLPIIAIDDMAAELDIANQHRLAEWLIKLGAQTFITALDGSVADLAFRVQGKKKSNYLMFHVKHGEFKT